MSPFSSCLSTSPVFPIYREAIKTQKEKTWDSHSRQSRKCRESLIRSSEFKITALRSLLVPDLNGEIKLGQNGKNWKTAEIDLTVSHPFGIMSTWQLQKTTKREFKPYFRELTKLSFRKHVTILITGVTFSRKRWHWTMEHSFRKMTFSTFKTIANVGFTKNTAIGCTRSGGGDNTFLFW